LEKLNQNKQLENANKIIDNLSRQVAQQNLTIITLQLRLQDLEGELQEGKDGGDK